MNAQNRARLLKLITMGLFVAIGVVISPILRIEGMCPTAHLVNVVCAVIFAYSPTPQKGLGYILRGGVTPFVCAATIGVIRMAVMGIPPLALTGAVIGAYLSGVLYRAFGGRIIGAVVGEIFGTGVVGSIVSYPIMAFLWNKSGIGWFFYTPMFISATILGGTTAYILLKLLAKTGQLTKIQRELTGANARNAKEVAIEAKA